MDCEDEFYLRMIYCQIYRFEEAAMTHDPLWDQVDKSPTISLNDLNGSSTYNCKRVMGHYGTKKGNLLN